MSASNALETATLLLYLNGTTYDGIAVNDTSSPNTDLFVALHTSDPGEAGTQATNEISYTGYARATVPRDSSGWTVTGDTGTNADDIFWGTCTVGSGTATHFSIGLAISGGTAIMFSGALTTPLAINVNITPFAQAGDLTVQCQ